MQDRAEHVLPGRQDARALLIIIAALTIVGLAMIYSSGAVVAERSTRFGSDRYLFLRRQAIWTCLGALAMMATASIPYRFWHRVRFPLLAISFALLAAVYVPGIGLALNGEHRWIRLGPYQMQPSEVCRLTLAIALCAAVARGMEQWRRFLPWAAVILASAGLVLFQRDVGSAVVLAALLSSILFVGGARLRHILLTGAAALALVAGAIVWAFPHARERIAAYLGASASYQVDQSIQAIGAGGLFGDGLGAGRAKLFYLPEAQSDFIFAAYAEELGFLGAGALILLYAALLGVGLRVFRRCADPFGRTLSFAIVASITLGAFVNIGVATGALPAKGIPLPFVSYGGSSLLVSMASIGILMNVATDETVDQRRRDGGTPDAGDCAGAGVAPAQL
jgi:cell division protein FtsW